MKKIAFLLVLFMLGLGTVSDVYAGQGYEAGKRWAAEKGVIDDAYENSDNSEDFNEGVRQYAIEQAQLQGQNE